MADEPYNREGRGNGLISRVAVLESLVQANTRRIDNIQSQDMRRLEQKIDTLRDEFHEGQRGMTTAEKVALGGTSAAVLGVIVAAIALFQGAPT